MKTTIKKPKRINYKKLAWNAFSKYIRRVGYCELHHHPKFTTMGVQISCSGVLQCCHKISRKHKAILFDERNVFCGCAGSNNWAHWNQLEWDKLWRQLWHEDVDYLEERKNKVVRFNNWTYKMIYEEYKDKI
jgi:hypothetical protein